ncbi:TetR family transcriptional regulator [Antricoccus suffuscus]|uniref:TetR family transcriptional regulator n=1 Tax=Antricoccus suffuscus TaxID=1629062 RepID=A0A2T0ZW27_9ACTN|nr:TetR/AcrR family transcriptional regulator [Antricoccus suffuscus]PRZ40457.1 TetR family transcriptional regulator [Antricoccus suffuscus]
MVKPSPATAIPLESTLTAKGHRTRQSLLDAARSVFERDGFLEARVSDITTEAGVANGTFYKYFDSKTDIFRAVMATVTPHIYDRRRPSNPNTRLTRIQRIERGIRQYVTFYQSSAMLMMLYDQAATYDPEIRQLRNTGRKQAHEKIRESIQSWQAEGAVDPEIDADGVASALVSMISQQLHYNYFMKYPKYGEERLVKNLKHVWVSALGLKPEPGDLNGTTVKKRAAPRKKRTN